MKQAILDNDAKDPQGKLIVDVVTVADFLPGTDAEQKEKLEVLDRIRDRLTGPRVLAELEPDEQRKTLDEMRPPETSRRSTAKDLPPLLRRRFEENERARSARSSTCKFKNDISFSDGHILLRIAKTTDNVHLPDGTIVQTASRSTIFAEMIRSMERDGPLATLRVVRAPSSSS